MLFNNQRQVINNEQRNGKSVTFNQSVSQQQRLNTESVYGTFCGSLQFKSLLEENADLSQQSVQKKIVDFLKYTLCQPLEATSNTLKQQLIDNWYATQEAQLKTKAKSVNYLSLEFLLGRAFTNALFNLKCGKQFHRALSELGYKLEDIQAEELDACTGNGGLGRLAACFLDSLATMNIPAYGYGLYYKFGMFKQLIDATGQQIEVPDSWLGSGLSPFPIVMREDITYTVQFGGHSIWEKDEKGEMHYGWKGSEVVKAIANDYLCPGYNTKNVTCIRLWKAEPTNSKEFNLERHFQGDYFDAIKDKDSAENITLVLYPNDATDEGRKLRLKQEYFFVSASIQDILHRAQKMQIDFTELPNHFSIQLNDTHPTLAIPELMRILLDNYNYSWDDAWKIVSNTINYTNHTVLPEALEKWSLPMFQQLLPRHTEIVFEINRRFIEEVKDKVTLDQLRNISIIDEHDSKYVRMANLAVIGSHKVNGVAKLHSQIIKDTIFHDFYLLDNEKFQNVTNGITPRRWIAECNPHLSKFITKQLKQLGVCRTEADWLKDTTILRNLSKLRDNTVVLQELYSIKQLNKQRLSAYISRHCQNIGKQIPIKMMFDTQVKRIHEYKRQQLSILQTISFYLKLKNMTEDERKQQFGSGICKIFAGKAASAYVNAKIIIQLINEVAKVVNNDPDTQDYLRVAFIPNYNVSLAELIFPATDISEQISTAGMEASGTGNMKACVNGGVILGTYDGANVEIADHVGEDNIFIFGASTEEVASIREQYSRGKQIVICDDLKEVISAIKEGLFGDYSLYKNLLNSIEAGNDWYLVGADFENYMETYLEDVIPTYNNKSQFAQMMLENIARMGFFSSDRAIDTYCKEIWDVQPIEIGGLN